MKDKTSKKGTKDVASSLSKNGETNTFETQ